MFGTASLPPRPNSSPSSATPKTGRPDGAYLEAVRKRFALWILDTADANHDQRWLDWQYEIGLRHNKLKKNQTDRAPSVPQVNFRYIPPR
jgi:hypothetical protein